MPGYWTLIARQRPSLSWARCTCPIDAAAIGCTSNDSNALSQFVGHSAFKTFLSWLGGILSASSRNLAIIRARSGEKKSPVSIEISCPIFMAAPRSFASWFVTLFMLCGVSIRSSKDGLWPFPSCVSPCIAIFPAIAPAIAPICPNRVS